MLHTLHQMFAPALMARLTLLVNHVLGGEPQAVQRLLPHVGKTVQIDIEGWPRWLPPAPGLAWQITPAGLLEWTGPELLHTPALRLSLRADDPLRLASGLAAGQLPSVEVSGDAQLATDVNWLMQNLRWDAAADLERVFPAPVAAALHRAGSGLARGLHAALQGMASVRERWQTRQGV
ncbi:MAG: hypothetical protein IPL57_22025 [Rubrivivax sp.]|nr:hypothetical protein [Rubrivivax sp.]